MRRDQFNKKAIVGLASLGMGLALVLASCGETNLSGRTVTYGESARANYEKGMEELKSENFIEAAKYFAFVKSKFPFSRYSTLAEMRMADTYFAEEKYVEAIDAYKQFIRFHPMHPDTLNGYAAYKVCDAYMKQIPTDWFLVPPSHEKDQSSTRDALRELTVFKKMYPESRYLKQVEKMHEQCIGYLTDHELYAARFYLDQDKPKAAILRLEGVLQRYPDAGVHPEVMLLLGKTYLKMNKKVEAKATFAELVRKHPQDYRSSKARAYLDYIDGRSGN